MDGRQALRAALGCALLFVLAPFTSGGPADPPAKKALRPMTVADLMKVRTVPEVHFSPAGTEVLYVVSEPDLDANRHNSDLWVVPVKGGPSLRLTHAPGRDDTPRWSPDGKTIAFLSDRSGDVQVWLLARAGGEAWRLTSAKGGVKDLAWCPDGKSIAFLATEPKKDKEDVVLVGKDLRPNHLHRIEIERGPSRRLTAGPSHVVNFAWSPDGRHIAYAHQPSPSADDNYHADLSVVSAEGGKSRPLVRRPGLDTSPRWSPDGKSIAFISNDGTTDWVGNTYLCVVPAEGGEARNLSKGFDEKVDAPEWSADGRTIYFTAHQRLTTQLFALAVATGDVRPISKEERVSEKFSFSQDTKQVAFVAEAPGAAPEVYVSGSADFSPRRLTSLNPRLAEIALGAVEPLRWKSKDGMEVEGLLVKPIGYETGKRYPLLTYAHGGPALQFRLGFTLYGTSPQAQRYPVQVLAGRGYAVFCPNPRGSGGYGGKFRKANIKDWGGGDYQDIQSGIDLLVREKIADPERLGMMGWSYGGYMTAWSIGQTDRFKAASAGAGLTDIASFYGQTDIPTFLEAYFGAPPWEAAKTYEKSSPITFARRVKTPTLIQFGEKDVRVPLPQGQELYRILKRNGVPVEFAVYPRQGHVVSEPRLQADVLRRNVAWFERWLKKGG